MSIHWNLKPDFLMVCIDFYLNRTLLIINHFLDDLEADSIQIDSATVQSDLNSESDSAVIATTTEDSSDESEGKAKTKVSKLKIKLSAL